MSVQTIKSIKSHRVLGSRGNYVVSIASPRRRGATRDEIYERVVARGVKSENAWQSRECAAINASRYMYVSIYRLMIFVPESRDAPCTTYRWRRETNGSRASRRLHPKSVRDLARPAWLGTRLTFLYRGRTFARRGTRRSRTNHPPSIQPSPAGIVRQFLIRLVFVIPSKRI